MKKILIGLLTLILSVGTVASLGACGDNGGSSTTAVPVYTTTAENWAESLALTSITNTRCTVAAQMGETAMQNVLEMDGETLRMVTTQSGANVRYQESVIVKDGEGYKMYGRTSADGVFSVLQTMTPAEYTEAKTEEFELNFDIAKGAKEAFANAIYDETNKVYTVTVDSFMFAAAEANIINAQYTVAFEDGDLKKVNCTFVLGSMNYTAEFIFGGVSITVPTVAE